MSILCRTVRSPHPKYRSMLTFIPEPELANCGGILPDPGTLYEEFPPKLRSPDYLKNFGKFVYVDQQEDGQDKDGNPGAWLIFAPGLTVEQAGVPFRSLTSFGNHRWPAILKMLRFFQDETFPLSTNIISGGKMGIATAPRTYDQQVFIPEVNEGTHFLEEEFFSPIPFNIPQYAVPRPTAVSYNVPGGASGNFPECLHPKIAIPDLRSGSLIFVAGAVSDPQGNISGQLFPATEMEEWESYTLSDKQKLQMGFYRYRVTVTPPDEPDTIVR